MPEKKVDPRFEQTHKKIKEAFSQLLDEKPLHSITVMEVTRLAHVNRSTFYTHYKDLLQLLQESIFDEVTLSDDPPTREDIFLHPEVFINRVQKVLEFYKLKSNLSPILLSQAYYSPYFDDYVEINMKHQYALQHLVQPDRSTYKCPPDLLSRFCLSGLCQVIYLYVMGRLPYTSREVAEYFVRLNILSIAVMTSVDPNTLPISTAKGSQTLWRVDKSIID